MDHKMAARNIGVLDGYFAPYIPISEKSKKVLSFSVIGNNPDVDTMNDEDVWDAGGRYTYLTSATQLIVSSSSANDTVGGSGLEYVNITGLDINYDVIKERVALNGTTTVITTQLFLRTLKMTGSKPGAADPNTRAAGTIQALSGTVQAQILAGKTGSSMALMTVPRGYTGFLDQLVLSGGAADDFIVQIESRLQGDIFVSRSDIEISNSNLHNINFDPRLGGVPEKSDIKVGAIAVSNNAQIRTSFTITAIRNDYLDSLARSI